MLRRCHWPAALAAALALAGAVAPAAPAAQEQGTPIAVAPGVPDQGRAWELVTAPDANQTFIQGIQAIAQSGDRVVYTGFGSLLNSPVGGPPLAFSLSERGPGGWINTALPPPEISKTQIVFPWGLVFDPELETSIWENPVEDIEANRGLFRRSPDGTYTLVGRTRVEENVIAASTDLSHFVFLTEEHLLAADTHTSGEALYEAVGTSLRLVGVDGGGVPLSQCGDGDDGPDSISDDGRKVFFTTTPCSEPPQVYLQNEGAGAIEISAPQCGQPDCAEGASAFLGATPSGASAFFTSSGKLTAADTNSHTDLYRYDVADGSLTLLSSGGAGPDVTALAESVRPVTSGATGAVRSSTDGSRVYFAGEEEGVGGRHIYLAEGGGRRLVPGTDPGTFMQASGDGRYLVFATTAQLVAADTDSAEDVYRYDAGNGTVALISSGPDGGDGPLGARLSPPGSGLYPPALNNPPQVMFADGGRIFFVTAERLVAADRNEADDVYEWAHGSVGLISAGAGEHESIYMGASPDGGTVFFATNDVLLPEDRDGADLDFYAARIGGGFPAAPSSGCVASCSPPPAGRAARPAPPSSRPLRGGIRVAGVAAAARGAAKSGWITLLVEVPRRGRLSAKARVRIGAGVGTASATFAVSQPGPVRVRLRLSVRARHALAAGRDLPARLSLRLSGLAAVRRIGFELKGSR